MLKEEQLLEQQRELVGAEQEFGPFFPPFRFSVSGLYQAWSTLYLPSGLTPVPDGPIPVPVPGPLPVPLPTPIPTIPHLPVPRLPLRYVRGELHLDVDGRYPQMTASGTLRNFFTIQVHWVANLTSSGANMWSGTIWYKDPTPSTFLYTQVEIKVARRGIFPGTATVTFSGGGIAAQTITYDYKSAYHHPVDFEFDFEAGQVVTDTVDTLAHPNHPSTLPGETLSVETVFRRAGFEVTRSPGGIVPVAGAGANTQWSDAEMHDAMQTYWSHFASRAQWAMWVFTARQHEMGTNLGGIMFDDIGPNHRQGTAIFTDSFISNPPAGDPKPAEFVRRNLFWTICHEMGHAFNLAHSWQKALGTPWIPLANDPEARSFMNYPYNVSGGQSAFFANFEYRFTDQELLFMRHAPERFVQMGNADWFDHHAFENANVSPTPAFTFQVRVNRDRPVFEHMEPVMLELKLTNASNAPQLVPENLLSSFDGMVVILKKDGKPARQFVPYGQYCTLDKVKVVMPGESIYESLYVSSGRNGWDIAEPGNYTVQIALSMEKEDVVSNALRVRILPPRSYVEEVLAQDYFSDAVGRIIGLDGSRFFNEGNDVLREIAAQLQDHRVALHANLALGKVVQRNYKQLIPGNKLTVQAQPAQPEEAMRLLSNALLAKPNSAAESFGHVDYKWYVDELSAWLAQQGERKEAASTQQTLYDTLSKRTVNGRPVLPQVLNEIAQTEAQYAEGNAKPTPHKRNGSRKK